MLSLSKIKKLFFIVLVLSFLTGNDCYCMNNGRRAKRNNFKNKSYYNRKGTEKVNKIEEDEKEDLKNAKQNKKEILTKKQKEIQQKKEKEEKEKRKKEKGGRRKT